MDVSALLYGFRAAINADASGKGLALEAARRLLQRIDPHFPFEDHVKRSCSDVVGMRFGGDATDAYYTTLLTTIRDSIPHIDAFLGAVLNNIVLQLNFQTRLCLNSVMGRTEAVVFEGSKEYFPVAMVHGNEVFGVHVTDLGQGEPALPGWAERYPEFELREPHLRRALPQEVSGLLAAAGRDRVGALLIVDPEPGVGELRIKDRYSYLEGKVSRHTIYCLSGTPEQVLATGRGFAERYSDCIVRTRFYTRRQDGELAHRAVLVCENVPELPDVIVALQSFRQLSFIEATPKQGQIHPGVDILNYFDGDTDRIEYREHREVGRWEPCPIRRPILLSSSAPLPEEARSRISDDTEIYHTLVGLKDGMLIPSEAPGHSTYIHATGLGEVLLDMGDERRNVESSPIYQQATANAEGQLIGKIDARAIVRVEGDAIPLTFTPILHRWHSHFVIQCLPRIQIIRALASDAAVLVPDSLRSKQLEMLHILGVPSNRIVKMPSGQIVQADRLLVPRAWRLAFARSTTAIYQELVDHFGCDSSSPRRRILISRDSRKTWRNLLNYDAVRQLLVTKYDFEEVAPERLSLEEEVHLYNNAQIIVGAEGAGLYGSIFSSAGTTVLSICDEDYAMPILGTLAYQRGFDVGYVFGESLRADTDLERRLPFGHADFVVDPRRVEEAVLAILAQKGM